MLFSGSVNNMSAVDSEHSMERINSMESINSIPISIALFVILVVTLIFCSFIIWRIVLKRRKFSRDLKNDNHFGFNTEFEIYDNINNEYNDNYHETIDFEPEEYESREYDKINYDELNVGENRTVEFTEILE